MKKEVSLPMIEIKSRTRGIIIAEQTDAHFNHLVCPVLHTVGKGAEIITVFNDTP
jgi:hypothetical protein